MLTYYFWSFDSSLLSINNGMFLTLTYQQCGIYGAKHNKE